MSENSSPIRVVQTRAIAESEHLVDGVIATGDGVERAWGDADGLVIARSSLKPIQVIPVVSSGAADAFGFAAEDIALFASSHSAEVAQLDRVADVLRTIGLTEDALECGATRPLAVEQADRLTASGEPFRRIHNCCSGKHAGFLAIAQHLGIDPAGYIQRDHPVQTLVTHAIETFTGFNLAGQPVGVDGCGIPTHGVPLSSLAQSMVNLVRPTGVPGLDPQMKSAADRVVASLGPNARWLSGEGRAEVLLAERATEALVSKVGAEGVFMAALPDRGIGIALKARDGARRAGDLAMEAVLADLGVLRERDAVHTVVNAEGTIVGTMDVHLQ